MATSAEIRDHQAWIGYLQPVGLVVSPAALVDSQVLQNRNVAPLQQEFLAFIPEHEREEDDPRTIGDLKQFLFEFLKWPEELFVGKGLAEPVPEELKAPLREFGETLEPTYALRNPDAGEEDSPWLLLILELPAETSLDTPVESAMAGWSASHTRRFERLMREAQVPIGLMFNRTHLRLIYAPRGENSGTVTFKVADMTEVAGRPILGALEMLLSEERLFTAPTEVRLPALLKRSRDYQGQVSAALAGQVLDALYELLRGFQSANDNAHGALLHSVLESEPNEIYNSLLTVLMRLVFLLYAEDQTLMPGGDLYVRNYAIHGLFERLRTDAEHYPDTMDHRFGAWAQVAALSRAIYYGCKHHELKMPAREGHLFDPRRFPFLEGHTPKAGEADVAELLPLVSDGVIYRVLHKLLILNGERLSYRTLDVEQIGSVYETMMGFRLELASGQTIALKPGKKSGAPVPVNLEDLLATASKDRVKWIKERTDYDFKTTKSAAEIKAAKSVDGLLAALEKRIARNATPQPVGTGTMVLMPTDERRKTGSHYTPRSLTAPIVAKALEPILKQLGDHPTPDQILDLKVCDPAMGSGAFLVEASRQLADELVKAWTHHKFKPYIQPDEDELLHAQRLIAQRCLYGVDRNPMAVDLAKLSLWLATLARDHPFTFLDHSLRCGDSLVGLTRKQIAAFHWDPVKGESETFLEKKLTESITQASQQRSLILSAGDEMSPAAKAQKLALADDALNHAKLVGDACIAVFFSADKKGKREDARQRTWQQVDNWFQRLDHEALAKIEHQVADLRSGETPVTPFHWELEFPEVFFGDNPGFDSIVGNPPFAGRNTIMNSNHACYLSWLLSKHPISHGNSDLAAHFFRQAFQLVGIQGTTGLIATNTIYQGDTKTSGLQWIVNNGGSIYAANKRYKWQGLAAVVVSIVWIVKGSYQLIRYLDSKPVDYISAFLFQQGPDNNPSNLLSNSDLAFKGVELGSPGFLMSRETYEVSNLSTEINSKTGMPVFVPYLNGEDLSENYPLMPERYVADIDGQSIDQFKSSKILMDFLDSNLKVDLISRDKYNPSEEWWHYRRPSMGFCAAREIQSHLIVCSTTAKHLKFHIVPTQWVISAGVIGFSLPLYSGLSVLQSRVHELWARFFGSTLEDRLRYTPSDVFDTFPFPFDYDNSENLKSLGIEYFKVRNSVMESNCEGLTKTYNRFHDPDESSPDILKLRELHEEMDRAVLDAYGWTDIQPTCEFLLDYEEEDEDEVTGKKSRRKKPWRYRWPDEIHDEVLARLLKLNAERAEEERRSGAAANAGKGQAGRKKGTSKKPINPNQITLGEIGEGE